MAVKTKRARVKLNKSIRLGGKIYAKGSTIEVDRAVASDIVSGNQGEFVHEGENEQDGRELEDRDQPGVRIEQPQHGDPGPKEISTRKK